MRTALLSTLERTQDGTPRAFLKLGGRPVLEWQAELAENMGCTRLVCLCDGPSPELIALQQQSEAKGVRLHLIRGPLQLVGLLSADDSIVVIADGLLPNSDLTVRLFGEGRGVATLPAEAGLAAGFERIDAANAWGGILVARANIAEKLADMPPDSDTVSLLLRLALQSGCRTVSLDTKWLHSGEWLLISESREIDAREKALLDEILPKPVWSGPGIGLAQLLARKLAPDKLIKGPVIGGLASAIAAVAAIAISMIGHPGYALIALAIASFSLATSGLLQSLRSGLFGGQFPVRAYEWGRIALDLALLAVLILPTNLSYLPEKGFLPLLAVGMLRVAEMSGLRRWSHFWHDRILITAILAAAAFVGILPQTLSGIVLIALIFLLFDRRRYPLTTD